MTTAVHLRKNALALPETVEDARPGMVGFSVRKREFVSLTEDGMVQLRLADDDAEAALSTHPTAERLVRRGTPWGIRVPLADVNGKDMNRLLRRSWLHCVPRRLAAQVEAADAGNTRHTLPKVGGPAAGALASAGITDLDSVAGRSKAELLAMHGVGPKAVRILEEALAESGLSFSSE